MTNDKIPIDKIRLTACILIGLLFGAFLGSPVPDLWAQHITKAISAAEDEAQTVETEEAAQATAAKDEAQAIKLINLHNGTADRVDTNGETEAVTATDSGIKIIVSDAPVEEGPPEYVSYNVNRSGVADRKEKDVLIRLINAEAYGLSYKAKVAVGQVVMNRWKGPYYGNDLLAIMTAPYQFTPIYDGSAYKKEIEPDSIQAANAVLSGTGVKELTDDTYYFVDPDFTEDKTIENKMQFVCEIEGIHFFKPPAI